MKKIAFLAAAVMLILGTLRADTLTLYLNQSTTDNLFQNSYAEGDVLSNLGYSLDKTLGRFTLVAEGSFAYLFENPDLTYYIQDVGLDRVWTIGTKSGFYASLTGRGTLYRADFSDFNYVSVNAYGAFKSYLSPTSILKAEYSLSFRDYRLSQFDQVSQAVDVWLDKYLQSRTTLKAGMSWGYKYYPHPFEAAEPSSEYEGVPSDQPGAGGMGKGMGWGKQGGMVLEPVPLPEVGRLEQGRGIQTLTLSGLIAQGLSDGIGLRISGVKQWSLSGENPFAQVWEFYMVENPFYDRFSWAGHELGAQLTALVPWDVQLQLSYAYSLKRFPGIEVIDLEGQATGIPREDTRHRWQARIEKDLSRFSLYLAYNLIENGSTDAVFDWNGNFFAVGIEWKLFLGDQQ